MSSAFHHSGRSFVPESVPKASFVAEVAPTAARGEARRGAVRSRSAALPPGGVPAGGRHACASEEAALLLEVAGSLIALRAAIARWRTAPRGAVREQRRRELERRQEALVAVLWGASRARLTHNEWRVVEGLLESGRDAATQHPRVAYAPTTAPA